MAPVPFAFDSVSDLGECSHGTCALYSRFLIPCVTLGGVPFRLLRPFLLIYILYTLFLMLGRLSGAFDPQQLPQS